MRFWVVFCSAERRKIIAAGTEAAHGMERPAGEGVPTLYSTEQVQSGEKDNKPSTTEIRT